MQSFPLFYFDSPYFPHFWERQNKIRIKKLFVFASFVFRFSFHCSRISWKLFLLFRQQKNWNNFWPPVSAFYFQVVPWISDNNWQQSLDMPAIYTNVLPLHVSTTCWWACADAMLHKKSFPKRLRQMNATVRRSIVSRIRLCWQCLRHSNCGSWLSQWLTDPIKSRFRIGMRKSSSETYSNTTTSWLVERRKFLFTSDVMGISCK